MGQLDVSATSPCAPAAGGSDRPSWGAGWMRCWAAWAGCCARSANMPAPPSAGDTPASRGQPDRAIVARQNQAIDNATQALQQVVTQNVAGCAVWPHHCSWPATSENKAPRARAWSAMWRPPCVRLPSGWAPPAPTSASWASNQPRWIRLSPPFGNHRTNQFAGAKRRHRSARRRNRRSFAVVADEVRQLAERTQEASWKSSRPWSASAAKPTRPATICTSARRGWKTA